MLADLIDDRDDLSLFRRCRPVEDGVKHNDIPDADVTHEDRADLSLELFLEVAPHDRINPVVRRQ